MATPEEIKSLLIVAGHPAVLVLLRHRLQLFQHR
jgi:hypothetical protein